MGGPKSDCSNECIKVTNNNKLSDENIENIELDSYENELIQALINILNK